MFGQWEFRDPWGVEGQKAGADAAAAAAAAAAAEEGTDPMWVIQVLNVKEADTSMLLCPVCDPGRKKAAAETMAAVEEARMRRDQKRSIIPIPANTFRCHMEVT